MKKFLDLDGLSRVLANMYTYFAPKTNATFTGTPTAPTPALGDSSTSVATTAFVTTAMNDLLSPSNISIQSTALSDISIDANASYAGTLSIAKSGYTPVCLAGYDVTGSAGYRCFICKYFLEGSTFRFTTRPSDNSAVHINVTVYVLYTKN